jgi:fumarylacetoacetate (FAA) hydrolase family protein
LPLRTRQYIGGYTIWVDCSARDVQARETLGPAKGKDWCTLLGPCITTPDAMDITTARCSIRVNGELWWEGRTNQKQHYGPEEMVAWASDHENLGPGDLIVLGTIAFGCSLDIGRWVKLGDLVEHWIEGIGTIKATVIAADGSHNYVRDGLPGHLPVPAYTADYLRDLADKAALRSSLGHSSPRPDEIAAGAPIKTLAHLQRV